MHHCMSFAFRLATWSCLHFMPCRELGALLSCSSSDGFFTCNEAHNQSSTQSRNHPDANKHTQITQAGTNRHTQRQAPMRAHARSSSGASGASEARSASASQTHHMTLLRHQTPWPRHVEAPPSLAPPACSHLQLVYHHATPHCQSQHRNLPPTHARAGGGHGGGRGG